MKMNKCAHALKGAKSARQRGQASIEYVLMLSSILVVLSAFLTAFHSDIARWFFMFIGQLLTR